MGVCFIPVLACCLPTINSRCKNWPIEDFTFIDQNGQQFGLADLKGKVWVADFILRAALTFVLQ